MTFARLSKRIVTAILHNLCYTLHMSESKSEQLGMSFSTAAHRLRKMVMFNLAIKLNENICFKCNNEIADINEFTIEHKIAWQGKSNELFWDLDNIAFSHSKCNRPEIFYGRKSKRRKDDLWLCIECEEYLPEDRFSFNKGTPRSWCKICRVKRKNEGKVF